MMKIVSAAAMLAVSASMLGTSTYAWFSMNDTVKVTGMSVTAKSDATFLMVKKGNVDADSVQSSKLTADSATTTTLALYPTAHTLTPSASVGISTIEAHNSTTDTNMNAWYYRYSSDPNDELGDNPTAQTPVTVADFDTNYVLVNQFSLAVADGSNELSNLHVKNCKITVPEGKDKAIKVLVAGANGCEEFAADAVTAANGGVLDGANVALQSANVTSSEASTVKVYVYWDGNDEDVYTNGIADLAGTAVEVEFTGTVV